MKTRHLLIPVALGVGLVLALMWILASTLPDTVLAAESAARVADRSRPMDRCALSQEGVITVCLNAACDFSSIQAAVEVASPGTVIKIAGGVYSDVHARGTAGDIITQVVYVGKNLTIRGGYSTTNWASSDPIANPTTLDGQGQGRVFFIEGETTVVINGLHITGGDANKGDDAPPGAVERGGRGGGLYASNATVTFTDNWVSGNTATRGGGLYLKAGTINLRGSTIGSNTAGYGGGAYLVDYGEGLGVARLDNNTFTSNAATGSITVTGQGGGILLLRSNQTTLNGNIIIANSAGNGGGLYLRESGTAFVNNIVADNTVTSAGGGLYVDASSPNLKHTAFARNSGNGGIYVTGGSAVELVNTIISTHTLGLNVAAGSQATLDTTLWYDNASNQGGSGTIAAGNNRDGNPAFEDPDAGDYHIRFDSEALDWAVPADVDTDIDEDERPRGDGFDLGPDEYPDFLSVEKEASPSPVRPGEQLVYAIRVTNYGGEVYTATISDYLPDHLIYSDIITRWASVTLIPDDEHPWKGYITVTVNPDYSGPLTNTVVVTTEQGETGSTYTVIRAYAVYLPLLLRGS